MSERFCVEQTGLIYNTFAEYTSWIKVTEMCVKYCTGLFISPSGISELDCATTKTDTAERSISIGNLSKFFFVLGALAYFHVPPLGVVVKKNGVHSE